MAERRSIVEVVGVVVFAAWLGWISWEVVGIKSDRNIDEKIHMVSIDLVRAIGVVSGNLNTEIERSKIKDDRQHGWLKFVNDTALENKGRIIEIEVRSKLQHGG